jgi:integrase/recombinase XerD
VKSITKTIDCLSSEIINYLKRLSYSNSRISQYRSGWQKVDVFMKSNNLTLYSASVGDAFIADFMGTREYSKLNRWEKDILRSAVCPERTE